MNKNPGIHIPSILRINIRWICSVLFLMFLSTLHGQLIRLDAEDSPLNLVLLQMASTHQVQISFDDQLLSKYNVTIHQTFEEAEEAIAFLLSGLPLNFQKSGEVFIIFKASVKHSERTFRLSGRVIDDHSGESLPYSHISMRNSGGISDFNGNFSLSLPVDSAVQIRISYLGYYILDTLLLPGTSHTLGLTPSMVGLKEVVIKGDIIERSGQVGEEAGLIRLNHKVAYRLPGNGDNAVFNFLRLQPGVLAAGERSSEMIIWGSYSGHSQVLFDGFTIFGLKNFNDNISFVNPYMAKDIRVLKGGYAAAYGDRVGGIVDITGFNGNTKKPSINLNINNMTVNGMATLPVHKNASITFAYRHTYYNLYDANDLKIVSRSRQNSSQADISVYPDYLFRDLNIKYAGFTTSGDSYYLSLYDGKDQFSYNIDQERTGTKIDQEAEEENRQLGGTLFYGHNWRNGNTSHLSLSLSGLDRDLYEKQEITRNSSGSVVSQRELAYFNRILETNLKNKNYFSLSENHNLETGWNYNYTTVTFREDQIDEPGSDIQTEAHRLNLYVQDEISVTRNLSVTPGIRIDFPFHLSKVYLQPRIKASFDVADHWRLNGAWGIYNQFISETSVIDDLGNYRYFWALCDNEEIPVLQAQHLVGGVTYRRNGFTLSMETFYKTTQGITRYVKLRKQGLEAVFQGDAKVYGVDLYAKKYLGKHEIWASYTLSKTKEYFPYFPDYEYSNAPQDQRHEVKGALLFNFTPIFFSVNYVYGSGFPDRPSFFSQDYERYPYSRLDAALIYRHSVKDYHFEVGLSILNLLNTENIKYSNFIRIPDSQSGSITVHAEAVPFTPTIYLNISF